MNKMIKKIAPYFLAIGIFFVTSFIQIPRDQAFICDHNGEGEHKEYRLEIGLPFAYIKRSVSDFECRVEGKELFQDFPSSYGHHEVSYLSFAADLYIWLTATYFLTRLLPKRMK